LLIFFVKIPTVIKIDATAKKLIKFFQGDVDNREGRMPALLT
jgi:hypothetical protein